LYFKPGQASGTFEIPIVDHGVPLPPRFMHVALYGGYPGGFANPHKATLTILNDDRQPKRIPGDPLGLAKAPTDGNPLGAVKFYNDPQATPALLAQQYRRSHPAWAHAFAVIASQPNVYRFGNWQRPDPAEVVSKYLEQAAYLSPGTVPLISTYTLVAGHCPGDTPAEQAFWNNWVRGLARGIGGYRAVVFLEEDSIITSPCLNKRGLAVRLQELRYGINLLLKDCPRTAIYIDAGAADALPARLAAQLLRQVGISRIQGFFLNSTHFDWTRKEINYGEQISKLTGGAHFVVNTGMNGQGPLAPPNVVKQGNEVLCNPAGRGLGPKPTNRTGFPKVDAFAWIDNPGQSDGVCGPDSPPDGEYYPQWSAVLVQKADYRVR
jgi:endoglucanase